MVFAMTDVSFTPSGPPTTILPDPPASLAAALIEGVDLDAIVADHPADPLAWAALGDSAGDSVVEAYAYYRVGYHRGLDMLRKHGWKGSGYVRWEHESNRGFLRCLKGLGEMAARIGETEEADRCAQFLEQLDPS